MKRINEYMLKINELLEEIDTTYLEDVRLYLDVPKSANCDFILCIGYSDIDDDTERKGALYYYNERTGWEKRK